MERKITLTLSEEDFDMLVDCVQEKHKRLASSLTSVDRQLSSRLNAINKLAIDLYAGWRNGVDVVE